MNLRTELLQPYYVMTTKNTYSVFYYITFSGDNEVFKMLTSSENIVGQAWLSWWVGKVLNTVFIVKEGCGSEGLQDMSAISWGQK